MIKKDTTKKLSSVWCLCCGFKYAEIHNAYCTDCREDMAKGKLHFDLFPAVKKDDKKQQ